MKVISKINFDIVWYFYSDLWERVNENIQVKLIRIFVKSGFQIQNGNNIRDYLKKLTKEELIKIYLELLKISK